MQNESDTFEKLKTSFNFARTHRWLVVVQEWRGSIFRHSPMAERRSLPAFNGEMVLMVEKRLSFLISPPLIHRPSKVASLECRMVNGEFIFSAHYPVGDKKSPLHIINLSFRAFRIISRSKKCTLAHGVCSKNQRPWIKSMTAEG